MNDARPVNLHGGVDSFRIADSRANYWPKTETTG
jgi:hypothetical protein